MQIMEDLSMTLSNKTKHRILIFLSFLSSFLLIATFIFCFKEKILFQILKYQISDTQKNRIINYLSDNEKGIKIAIADLSKTRESSRGGAFFILIKSHCSSLDDILHKMIFSPENKSNVIQIIELTCVMLERTGKEEYLYRMYELVRNPHQFEMVNAYDYEIYLGRLYFLKHAEMKLTEQELELLANCPRNSVYPTIKSMTSAPTNRP